MITSAVVRRALMAALFWYACSSAASRGGTGGEGGLVEVREALWMFDAAESWFVWKDAGDERNTPVSATPAGTRVELNGAKDRLGFPVLSSRACQGGSIGRPVSLSVKIELLEGAASVGLNLQDARGEGMNFGDRPLQKGSNDLVWNIAEERIVHSWGNEANKRIDGDLSLWNLMFTAATVDEPVVALLVAAQRTLRCSALSLVDVSLVTGNPGWPSNSPRVRNTSSSGAVRLP
jgi:hypothetical protein